MADLGMELLQPLRLGGLTLRNRIAMSAMTRSRTPGGVPNELNALYYRQRAGAGIVFAESTAVSAHGIGFADTPGIFTDEQVLGWKRVTDGVHSPLHVDRRADKGSHLAKQWPMVEPGQASDREEPSRMVCRGRGNPNRSACRGRSLSVLDGTAVSQT